VIEEIEVALRGGFPTGAPLHWNYSARKQTELEMTHRYKSGQTVRLHRNMISRSAPDGEYKIVRQLPENAGEPQYTIKSMRESHERVVKESELEKV
jgi:hypothetical protein